MKHIRRFLLLLAMLPVGTFASATRQVMLADSITKNPVSYATVYDANGTVIGRSDMGGYINLQKGFEYNISHIGYEPRKNTSEKKFVGNRWFLRENSVGIGIFY